MVTAGQIVHEGRRLGLVCPARADELGCCACRRRFCRLRQPVGWPGNGKTVAYWLRFVCSHGFGSHVPVHREDLGSQFNPARRARSGCSSLFTGSCSRSAGR